MITGVNLILMAARKCFSLAMASTTSWTAISSTFRLQVLGSASMSWTGGKIPEDELRTKRKDLADEQWRTRGPQGSTQGLAGV
jgi:hypothetical protein